MLLQEERGDANKAALFARNKILIAPIQRWHTPWESVVDVFFFFSPEEIY